MGWVGVKGSRKMSCYVFAAITDMVECDFE
jgi:hypothetical protein